MDTKTSDWRPGPSVCRCCLTEGCYKDISTEYFWMGKKEVYAEMLSDTFSISIAYSQSGGPNSNSRLICEPCIARLRDASDFRRQVLECEKTFMHHLDPGSSSAADIEIQPETTECEVKLERVKLEKRVSDDDFDDRDFLDDDDDLDDEPLTKLASKVPKKESVDLLDLLDNSKLALKRKSATKVKASAPKKAKTKKEPVKPAPSKVSKPEKKKKDLEPHGMAKRNAEVVLQYSTVNPFRLRGKLLLCVYCCEEFSNPDDFRQHMDEKHKKFTVSTAFAHTGKGKELLKVDCSNIRCRICSETFETIEDVAYHIRDYHKITDKKLNLEYTIGMQPYRLENDKWNCFICNMKLPSLTKLCRHTTSHYQGYTCDVCGKAYLTIDALRYHIKCRHSGNNVCRKCWQDFPTTEKKRDHVKVSKKCWPFACIYCGDRFLSWEQKQRHLVGIHDLPPSTYTCPDCNEVYLSRKHFYNHYKMAHTDENFVCSCCGLKFASKHYLDDHKIGHTGEKLFKCSVCDKKFTRNKSLSQHMWLHSETKRFGCTICEKQFVQKVSLKGHMKSHHPDVPFLC